MFSTNQIILSDSVTLHLINALYRYYEKPESKMTIGELYLLLKMIVSKLEDELESKGLLEDVDINISK